MPDQPLARLPLGRWWLTNEFPRYLGDLLRGELARIRPGDALPQAWKANLDLGQRGLDLDSLERLRLATAAASALSFAHIGAADHLQQLATFGEWIDETRRVLRGAEALPVGFKSSGSSGEPKLVTHDFAWLAQEIDTLEQLFADTSRIVSFTPAHHIYGFLFTILLPARLGCAVLDARAHTLASFGGVLQAGDLVIAFPTIWQAAAEARLDWPENVRGVTSGAPCPDETAQCLRAQGLRLTQIYGSTETGGIGWRDEAGQPYRLFPYWTRQDDDHIGKTCLIGTLRLQTPDVVRWEDATRITPLRRRDGAVQVGGVNVYPELVAAILAAHPGVAGARVRLMRPEEGERLKAFIVPKKPEGELTALRRDLDDWMQTRLRGPERPRAIAFGPKLPLSPQGKPADWSVEPA